VLKLVDKAEYFVEPEVKFKSHKFEDLFESKLHSKTVDSTHIIVETLSWISFGST
jgi:hypothetical protein